MVGDRMKEVCGCVLPVVVLGDVMWRVEADDAIWALLDFVACIWEAFGGFLCLKTRMRRF